MTTGTHVVIVGGGLAGWRAAEELRAAGFAGQLTLLSDEEHPPYDRPPLSKRLLKADVEPAPIVFAREGSDEASLRLDLRRGVRAVGIRPGTVLTAGGSGSGEVSYDALVIATGVRARELPALAGHPHVHLLRTFDDVLALRSAMDAASSMLVVGAGFIGAEVATAAHDRGISVTVIEALDVPYQRTLGPLLGAMAGRMAGRYGVTLRTGVGVADVAPAGSAGSVHVQLTDGSALETDLAVVGVGTELNIEWVSSAGAHGWKAGVTCDGAGRVTGLAAGFERIYALGDVAAWHDEAHDDHRRFEHWTTAVDQAPLLAHALVRDLAGEPADDPDPLLPYFWSDQYGRKLQLLGRPGLADTVDLLHGSESDDPAADAPRKVLVGLFRGRPAGRDRRHQQHLRCWAVTRPLLAEAASRERVLAFAAEQP